jgi:hypothetical protein
MVTLREFLDGEPLPYVGFNRRETVATYRVGVGIYVEQGDKDLGVADVDDDERAAAFYHNMTREVIDDGEDEE